MTLFRNHGRFRDRNGTERPYLPIWPGFLHESRAIRSPRSVSFRNWPLSPRIRSLRSVSICAPDMRSQQFESSIKVKASYDGIFQPIFLKENPKTRIGWKIPPHSTFLVKTPRHEMENSIRLRQLTKTTFLQCCTPEATRLLWTQKIPAYVAHTRGFLFA